MLKFRRFRFNGSMLMVVTFFLSLSAGFFLSGAETAGVASFADISLSGATGVFSSSAVLTGSIVRSIIGGRIGANIVKISSMIIIVTAKLFLDVEMKPKTCGIITASAVILSGTAVSVVLGELVRKLFFYIFYGAVSGITAYASAYIILGLKKRLVVDLSGRSGCAYAIVYITIISSLCSVKMPLINIGIIAGTGITLLSAYYYGNIGGVLSGALTACGAFLASGETGMTVVLLPASGLMTGYLRKQKPFTTASFFASLSFILMILTGITRNNAEIMLNIVCGSGLFVFTAPYYSDKWVSTGTDNISVLPEIINARMSFLSDSIGTVRAESGKIAEVLEENCKRNGDMNKISCRVCSSCFRKKVCWDTDKEITIRAFHKVMHSPEIALETFPYELEACIKKQELSEEFSRFSRERMTSRILKLRSSGGQQVLSEQIKITEEIIRSAGEKIDVRYSGTISRQVEKKLAKYGIIPRKTIAYYNTYNRLIIELYFLTTDAPDNTVRLCDLTADELELSLDIVGPAYSGREVRYRLFEKPEYSLEVYGASVCAEGSEMNGDTSTVFTDGTGVGYVILSDGMGSGKDAALESRLVVRMFRKLINSGVNFDSAIRLINSIMVSKSGEESFATLDAVRIDLDSCGLTVIKSGASATLIRHRGGILKVSSPTFPIGIYEQSDVFSSRYSFEDGDMIVMFSDGIDEGEYGYIKELLMNGNDVRKIVTAICDKAPDYNPNLHGDDVTVVGIRISRRSA